MALFQQRYGPPTDARRRAGAASAQPAARGPRAPADASGGSGRRLQRPAVRRPGGGGQRIATRRGATAGQRGSLQSVLDAGCGAADGSGVPAAVAGAGDRRSAGARARRRARRRPAGSCTTPAARTCRRCPPSTSARGRGTCPASAPPRTYGRGSARTCRPGRWRRRRRATCPARRSSPPRSCGESLTRLQAGETGFDLGGGTFVRFSGIPQGKHNVLRDLQESRARQPRQPARVDDDRAGRDAVRLHLRDPRPARRHQGAARAAADPGAEGGDARRRVLREEEPSVAPARQRARAGRARLVAGDGARGSALRKIHDIVHQILDNFTDDLSIFESCATSSRRSSPRRRRPPRPTSRRPPRRSTSTTGARSRRWWRRPQIERRIETYPVPNFLAVFLRQRWAGALERIYLEAGDESEAWDQAIATRRGPGLERAAEADAARTAGTWSRCCRRC